MSKIATFNHYIGGAFTESVSKKRFDDINPATNEVIATVAEGGYEDVDNAVKAARKAFKTWSKMPVQERSKYLMKIADGIDARMEEFARWETADTGKPIALSRTMDIPRGANNFRVFADVARYLHTEVFETEDRGALNYSLRRPVGVAGLISPWNLPLLLLTWKIAPCLAAGNTCVMKPAELTPATASLLCEVAAEVGLPEGVMNLVHGFGPNATGSAITEHPDIQLVSFTGETSTGKAIMRAASGNLKRLSFELGGKNPVLVFADANMDAALETVLKSSFTNQGEVCLCGSRVYVERPIFEEFVERLTAAAKSLVVGDPMDDTTQMGALVSREHLERVESYIASARTDGGVFRTGGERLALGGKFAEGNFLQPTIITGLSDECKIIREEVFGPVITVSPFDTEAEVIERANATHYGLSASVWTENLSRAHRLAGALEVGVLWINTWYLRDLRTPFGGAKQSGIGREGGVHSFEFFTELKNVCIKL